MACTTKLRDALGISCTGFLCELPPAGGQWFLSESGYGYPVSLIINGVPQTINSPEDVLNGGDNPEVDMSKMPLADYTFKYVYGNCNNEAFVYMNGQEPPCQAEDIAFTICDTQGVVSIYDSMVSAYEALSAACIPTMYGDFTLTSANTPVTVLTTDRDATNDTIDTGASPADTYVFEYVYEPVYNSDCDVCQKMVTVSITIAPAPSAGTTNDVVICT